MRLILVSDENSMVLNENEVVRIAVDGQITQDAFDASREPIRVLLGPLIFSRTVLLNLEKATYISSSGVSWLLLCHKNFVQAKGKFILHSVPPVVSQVLDMLRLNMILVTARDEAEALTMAKG